MPCCRAGIPADGHTYVALARGYAQSGDLPRALGVLDHMAESGETLNHPHARSHEPAPRAELS